MYWKPVWSVLEDAGVKLLGCTLRTTSWPAPKDPCLDTLGGRNCVYAHDIAEHGENWPRFAPRAVAGGIRSVLAYRLFHGTGTLGALNLYATLPPAYGVTARAVGSVYAAHAGAAVAVAHSRDADTDRTEHLRHLVAPGAPREAL